MEALVAGLLAGYGVAVPVGAIAALIISLTARTGLVVGVAAALGVATADGLFAMAAVLGGATLARFIEPIDTPLRWVAAVVLIGLAARTAIMAIRRHPEANATASGEAGLTTFRPGASAEESASGQGSTVEVSASSGQGASVEESASFGQGSTVEVSASSGQGSTAEVSASFGPGTTAEESASSPRRAYLGLLALTLLNPMTIVYFGALVLGRQSEQGLTAAAQVVFVVAAFAASASWQLLLAGGGSLVGRVLTGTRGRLATALVSSGVIAVLAIGLVVSA